MLGAGGRWRDNCYDTRTCILGSPASVDTLRVSYSFSAVLAFSSLICEPFATHNLF